MVNKDNPLVPALDSSVHADRTDNHKRIIDKRQMKPKKSSRLIRSIERFHWKIDLFSVMRDKTIVLPKSRALSIHFSGVRIDADDE